MPARAGKMPRPPKQWFDAAVHGVIESGSALDPKEVVGALWYHKMSARQRAAIIRRYEPPKRRRR